MPESFHRMDLKENDGTLGDLAQDHILAIAFPMIKNSTKSTFNTTMSRFLSRWKKLRFIIRAQPGVEIVRARKAVQV